MRPVIFALSVFVFTAVANSSAIPEEKAEEKQDILRRLMAEPVTLMDWGLAQLDRDLQRATRMVFPKYFDLEPGQPYTGTIYDWRSNLITAYVSAALPVEQRTKSYCIHIFTSVIRVLTEGSPKGHKAAGWYLKNTFQPKAHFWASRFEDVVGKLLAASRLEITFLPPTFEAVRGDTKRMRCSGRFDAAADELTFEGAS